LQRKDFPAPDGHNALLHLVLQRGRAKAICRLPRAWVHISGLFNNGQLYHILPRRGRSHPSSSRPSTSAPCGASAQERPSPFPLFVREGRGCPKSAKCAFRAGVRRDLRLWSNQVQDF